LEELEVLTPNARGYDADDVAIIEAISRFRAGGYEQAIGFTVYDTLRYREALEPLVEEEVRVLLDRLAGKVDVDRAVQIISSGAEPLRELIGAMHSKLLLAALRRARGRASDTLTDWSIERGRRAVRVGAVQLNSTEDTARNLETADRLVRDAAGRGAEVVVLPEKWSVLGTPEHMTAGAEPPDGPLISSGRGAAREAG